MSLPAENQTQKIRVLRISHSGLTPELRERERVLVRRHPDISLELVTARSWYEGARDVTAQAEDLFPVHTARTFLSRRVPLFAFDPRPIIATLRRYRPHVIDMVEESYMISCIEGIALCRWLQPNTPIVLCATQNVLRRYPPPFEFFQQQTFRSVVAAYPCSRSVLEVLRAKGFDKPARIIPFGVRLESFPPRPHGAAGPITIGFVGRMVVAKGIFVLARALGALPARNWRAILVGDGPERERLKQCCQECGILDRVQFVGAVSYRELASYYRQMDVLVLPTLTTRTFREQFGRVLIEAMASRVCLIGSTSGSIPEVIGEAGLIVPEGDHLALAGALELVMSNEELRLSLAQAGRKRVEQYYTWDRVADQMYELYREAIKN